MKYNKIFSALAGLFLLGAATTSCSDDWNDHYADGFAGSGESMWAAMAGKPELSNFVKVLQATGYDKDLSSSQVFTAFAPTNAQLTDELTQQLIDSYTKELNEKYNGDQLKRAKTATVKEFVQNHIALYNYSVSDAMEPTNVRMLNGKYINFTNDSFASNKLKEKNIVTGNGVLFTMDEVAKFVPNIFEYIKMDENLSDYSSFIYMSNPYQFHVEVFQPEESVPGEIINGQQHFLDSVTISQNEILEKWLRARLDKEDSTYYALMPTNAAWADALKKTEQYYVYDKKVDDRDSLMYTFPRMALARGLQFSTSQNPLLGKSEDIDSIVSPLAMSYSNRKMAWGSYDARVYEYLKPFSADGIFGGTTRKECSNGVIFMTDKWNVPARNTYMRDIVMEAEGNALDSLSGKTQAAKPKWTRFGVSTDNPFYNQVSGNSYYTLSPSTATQPGALFDFKDVLSNMQYDMYITTVPAIAGDTLSVDTLPTRFEATVYWHDANGKEVSAVVGKDTPETDFTYDDFNSLPAKVQEKTSASEYQGTKSYTAYVDPTQVKKIKIGRFTFPTCSYNLDQPQVKVLITVKVRNPRNNTLFTTSLRIDKLSLEPVAE